MRGRDFGRACFLLTMFKRRFWRGYSVKTGGARAKFEQQIEPSQHARGGAVQGRVFVGNQFELFAGFGANRDDRFCIWGSGRSIVCFDFGPKSGDLI